MWYNFENYYILIIIALLVVGGVAFAVLKTDDNKYIVYDLDKNKEMFKTDSYPGMNYEHYITTTSNGKTQYYTYDGKMFYEK